MLELWREEAFIVPVHNLEHMQGLGVHQDAVGVEVAVAEDVLLLARRGLVGWPAGLGIVVHDPQRRDYAAFQAGSVGTERVQLREDLVA